jgi:MFS family permease
MVEDQDPKQTSDEEAHHSSTKAQQQHEDDESSQVDDDHEETRVLTGQEKWNLACLILAYACVICSMTLVVGTSAVIVLSVGGSNELAPIALAMFFSGSAFISLLTSSIFSHGRRFGFLVGIVLGIFGAGLGAVAVVTSSPLLVLFSSMPLGAANGVGMYLRFAAVEVVPVSHKAFAVTLVLSGGCIAAFAGPESSIATKHLFGDDMLYLGTFMMIAVFNTMNAVFVAATKFPTVSNEKRLNLESFVTLWSVLKRRQFWIPALIASFVWAVMAMPMSVARLAMQQIGFSSRQSLLTIELHFLGMFAPGFFTGKLLQRFGALPVTGLSIGLFVSALIIHLLASFASLVPWIVGLVIIGVGWNLGFSSTTVLLTQSYAEAPLLKAKVQAANDFIMFFLAGSLIFSTGYIYESGGSEIMGWKTVNYVVIGLTSILSCIVACEYRCHRASADRNVEEKSTSVIRSETTVADTV